MALFHLLIKILTWLVGLTQIVITFDQTVALGSTGKLEIRTGGLLGTVADTFGVGEMVLNPQEKYLQLM